MANVLVTGAAGFLGSHLVDDLLALDHAVVALDNLSGGYRDNVNPRAEFVEGDVCDPALMDPLFERHKFDYVFHLAAYAAEGLSHFIRRFNYTNNVIGSVNLVNAAVRFESQCFVFTSSIAVYGTNQLPMREDLTPQPEDPYGIAKWTVEQDLRAAHELFGLNYLIFRPHNVYGERQNIADRYRNVVGIFMNQILQGQPLTVFGDGEQTRAFTYVKDVTPVLAGAVTIPAAYGQTFNIGSDKVYTLNQLARTISAQFGVEPEMRYLPPRQEVKHAYTSHEKLAKFFGYQPRYSLEEGLARMAAAIKQLE